MRKLIIARARKNKRTARMLANARKDHSIPLKGKQRNAHIYIGVCQKFNVLDQFESMATVLQSHRKRESFRA